MGHNHSSPGIEGQGHKSKSKVKMGSMGPRMRPVLDGDMPGPTKELVVHSEVLGDATD